MCNNPQLGATGMIPLHVILEETLENGHAAMSDARKLPPAPAPRGEPILPGNSRGLINLYGYYMVIIWLLYG